MKMARFRKGGLDIDRTWNRANASAWLPSHGFWDSEERKWVHCWLHWRRYPTNKPTTSSARIFLKTSSTSSLTKEKEHTIMMGRTQCTPEPTTSGYLKLATWYKGNETEHRAFEPRSAAGVAGKIAVGNFANIQTIENTFVTNWVSSSRNLYTSVSLVTFTLSTCSSLASQLLSSDCNFEIRGLQKTGTTKWSSLLKVVRSQQCLTNVTLPGSWKCPQVTWSQPLMKRSPLAWTWHSHSSAERTLYSDKSSWLTTQLLETSLRTWQSSQKTHDPQQNSLHLVWSFTTLCWLWLKKAWRVSKFTTLFNWRPPNHGITKTSSHFLKQIQKWHHLTQEEIGRNLQTNFYYTKRWMKFLERIGLAINRKRKGNLRWKEAEESASLNFYS